MKKLFILSSILALFFIGCGDTQTCKDLVTVLKCGDTSADAGDTAKKCSALPEAQQTKLLACHKNEQTNYCAAVKKAKALDAQAIQEILRIALKCESESKK